MNDYTLTEDQAIALRMFIAEHWAAFLASSNYNQEEADALYAALGGEE